VRTQLDPSATTAAAPVSATPLMHGLRAEAPELTMVAPVEMWFGDARVGVKAGTKTYSQFRRYADVLLGDLKAKQPQAR
jgi:hypothetical protein